MYATVSDVTYNGSWTADDNGKVTGARGRFDDLCIAVTRA